MAFSFKHLHIISFVLIQFLLIGCGSSQSVQKVEIVSKKKIDLYELDKVYYVKGTHDKFNGSIIDYYERSETKFSEAFYVNGVANGKLTFWEIDGTKASETERIAGKKNGKSIQWWPNGNIKRIQYYIDDETDGLLTNWNENGIKLIEESYQAGKLYNRCEYWSNGKKKSEDKFKVNSQECISTNWYENGVKSSESKWVEGKLNGKYLEWWENGAKYMASEYKDGKQIGICMEWFNNGKKKSEGIYENGKLNGKFVEWDEKGKKLNDLIFLNDKPYSGKFTEFSLEGKVESEKEYAKGELNGKFIEWDESGNKLNDVIYNMGSPIIGKLTEFYPNKVKKSEIEYKDGKRNGKALFWKENGVKNGEYEYVDDYLKGKEIVREKSMPIISHETIKDEIVDNKPSQEESASEAINLSKVMNKINKTKGLSIYMSLKEGYIIIHDNEISIGIEFNEDQIKKFKASIDRFDKLKIKPPEVELHPQGVTSSIGIIKIITVYMKSKGKEGFVEIKDSNIIFKFSNQAPYFGNPAFIMEIPKLKSKEDQVLLETSKQFALQPKLLEKIKSDMQAETIKIAIENQPVKGIEEVK